MTILKVTATQLSNQLVEVGWEVDAASVLGFEVTRDVNPPNAPAVLATSIGGTAVAFGDDQGITALTVGDVLLYTVEDLDGGGPVAAATILVQDLEVPFTHAPPAPTSKTIRYTTLDTVKNRLGIPLANVDKDDRITQVILAAAYSLEAELGQAFPSTGSNPQYNSVPANMAEATTDLSVAFYKAGDSPAGQLGSDDFLGSLDFAELVTTTMRRNPMLSSFKIQFGTG